MSNNKNSLFDTLSNAKDTFPRSVAGTGTITTSAGGKVVIGTGTLFKSQLQLGDWLYVPALNEVRRITSISSDTSLTVDSPFTSALVAAAVLITKSSLVEISVVFSPDDGVIDTKPLAANIGFFWGKTGRDMSANRDKIDPIIIDATGTVAYVQGLK